MYSREDDINDRITFRRLQSNVTSSPEYKEAYRCLFTEASCQVCPPPTHTHTHTHILTLPPFSWEVMHLSTRRKALHGPGLGWHSIKCAKLSSSSWLGLAELHSSQHKSKGEESRSGFSFTSERKTKNMTRDKKMLRSTDVLFVFFPSVNQRCYLTQVPYVISITFDDTKDNQRFFLIARPLWVVFKAVWCMWPLPPFYFPLCFCSWPVLLPFPEPPTCNQPMHPLFLQTPA